MLDWGGMGLDWGCVGLDWSCVRLDWSCVGLDWGCVGLDWSGMVNRGKRGWGCFGSGLINGCCGYLRRRRGYDNRRRRH